MSTPLKGHVALVTGGASGLGATLVDVLTEAGAHVIVADVKPDAAKAVAAAAAARGADVDAIALDVAAPGAISAAVDAIARDPGRLDILVNCAGVDRTVPLEQLTAAEWDRILSVNLSGPFYLMRAVFPLIKRQGGGHIVNVASTAAKRAWSDASAYHASKWGLLGLSHAAHVEG